jgi:acyl carrier protein
MKDRIFQIIASALAELNSSINSNELYNPTLETRLYGLNAALDSMSLVTLISDIEDRINTEFQIDIVLADERAMSRARSPFGSVGTLVEYIEQLLVENK